ncbi:MULTISPECIES: ABC transporter permease [unclassified Oceanispirochaeta]|uniref:ABC transporter permease n=1 Tax=unclassified Oceanispirochaeta TaxID=2635722 RepID=UPI000E096707|nr:MULTISPECIES: ABC transporter permease subunit [unclassified Oceanispirochaeta]MBF9016193.1 ABC transporter permease subunit [Oceanispirochaeta sp. M2]NPD72655.1 ABC transporter permease subunit [Oceanispirochaeta sp. M1]RDG31805.1 ABC transporter permease subunit [Oceanispirochaeta sp. M1]
MISESKRMRTTLISLALYLSIWKLLSVIIGRSIILPPPEEVLLQTLRFLGTREAWTKILATSLRGLGGFSISLILGIATGLAAGKSQMFKWFSDPFLISIRSIPVLSLILLAVIWFPTELVPVFICFLIAYPVISSAVASGVNQVDRELLEMAAVYNKSHWTVLKEITLPSVMPYLLNGVSTGLGLTWKSVVAAEVLSMPASGLGTAMQTAQLQLDTAHLFAWTLIVVLLASLSESLLRLGEKKR